MLRIGYVAGTPFWLWATFGGTILILLVVDLFLHRGERRDTLKSASAWSVVWILAGLAFGLLVLAADGTKVQSYYAAYLLEKSLSIDNLFLFLLVFRSLDIPRENQRTVLSWGIFGALVFRALLVVAGWTALQRWEWVIYVFAGLLLLAAIRTFREDPTRERESRTVRFLSKHLPVTRGVEGNRFFVEHEDRRMATPLFVAVCAVEMIDIVFAVDSIPAAFSVARDPFVVYSSNAFAVLGLRALYILLASMMDRLTYLHYGLAVILAFAAVKMILHDLVEIPAWVSMGVTVLAIAVTVPLSIHQQKKQGHRVEMGFRSA